ncbi:GerAB/ArcD/ProY family transporter [Clostridiaceae bacterium 35-E11]
MRTKEYISGLQFCAILYAAIGGIYIILHNMFIELSGRASGVAELLSTILLVPLLFWILYIGSQMPGKTIFEIIETTTRPCIARILAFLYSILLIFLFLLWLNYFTTLINIFLLQRTPPWIINFSTILLAALIAGSGAEVCGRMAIILYLVDNLIFHLGSLIVSVDQMELRNLFPIFIGQHSLSKGIYFGLGAGSVGVLMAMIFIAFLKKPQKNYTLILSANILSGIIFMLAVASIYGILGVHEGTRIAFGSVNVIRLFKAGDFVQGLEIFTLLSYFAWAYYYLPILLVCASRGILQIFNYKGSRINMVCISLLIFVASFFIENYNKVLYYLEFFSTYIFLPFCIVVMIIVSISLWLWKKKINKRGVKEY